MRARRSTSALRNRCLRCAAMRSLRRLLLAELPDFREQLGRRRRLAAAITDEGENVVLEAKLIATRRTQAEVRLDLTTLLDGQLAIEERVELVEAFFTIHRRSPIL